MRKFIVIAGPTATGKTAISVKLAKFFDTQIISADSCQIYTGMDIGTAKITPTEMEGVKHHFIDITEPSKDYSVALFQKEAFKVIEELNENERFAIVAGGTGLYINSLIYELDFSGVSKDDMIRQKYLRLADDKSVEYLYNELKQIDPKYAKIIAKTDIRRIIRRLEILEKGGSPDYEFRKKKQNCDIIIIGLKMQRDILYSRINKRVDIMLKYGLEKEVKALYNKYGKTTALKAIGYKELIGYFEGKYDYDEAVRLIKRNSRRLAKRQLTWFKRDDRIKWFDVSNIDGIDKTVKQIIEYIKEKGF